MRNVYISGALTNLSNASETKTFYEAIGEVCSKFSFTAYIPHKYTDPKLHPELTPQEIFAVDKTNVTSSDMVIAYVGKESLGVGMELAYAETNCIPVVLMYHHNQTISRIVRGMPNLVAEIVFGDFDDGLNKLETFLSFGSSLLEREIHLEVLDTPTEHRVILLDSVGRILFQEPLDSLQDSIVSTLVKARDAGVNPLCIYVDHFSPYISDVKQVWQQAKLLYEYQ